MFELHSGGLGDGPHTVPYPRAIADALIGHPDVSFSVFEFRLSSSFDGFGFLRLADDVADMSAFVKYLRSIGKERVVLMGHSTGTQVRPSRRRKLNWNDMNLGAYEVLGHYGVYFSVLPKQSSR